MYRPPPEFFWRQSKLKYEKQFRGVTPQWVLTLEREDVCHLLEVCCRLGLRLHPQVLTLAESFSGRESLWDDRPCFRHDQPAKPKPSPKPS
jgi:hypothetical protein